MNRPLRILHCLRAPVGGLFRHVLDLCAEQSARGHLVAMMADASTGNALTAEQLRSITPSLALGLHRIAMSRYPGLSDFNAVRFTRRLVRDLDIDIVHGHGAKGGAYARLAAATLGRGKASVFYTPHGGSLHYRRGSLSGRLFLGAERALARATDGLIFESAYASRIYNERIGAGLAATRVIHNGITEREFEPVAPSPTAADFLFIGELRDLKGIDVLLSALAKVGKSRAVTAVIVGEGPDEARFHQQAGSLGLAGTVQFKGALPARQAFHLARCLVVPSRAESLPYVVLEAAGAGLPLIATSVGGIPEIVAGTDTPLIPAGDVDALAGALAAYLDDPEAAAARARRLRAAVAERFTVPAMASAVLDFYRAQTVR